MWHKPGCLRKTPDSNHAPGDGPLLPYGADVGKETYTAKDTDFSAILTKISAAKPDLVYLPDYYNVVNLAVKQAKEKGIKVPLTGGA